MILLNQLLKKLLIECVAVPNWMVFLKTRPFVKWNNPEFTNVSSFTLLPMCSTHFKLSCRKHLALPTCNSFCPVCVCWNTCTVCLGGSYWGRWMLGASVSSAIHQNWTLSDSGFWYLRPCTSCRKFLYFIFCLCLVFYTQMHWRVHNLTDAFGRLRVFLRTE